MGEAAELIASNEELAGLGDVLALCGRICRWEMAPTTWSGGRAGWQILSATLSNRIGVSALKFKGLGLGPRGGEGPKPPQDVAYDRWPGQTPDLHFGIGPDLEFMLSEGDAAPVGGLALESALREFKCAESLQKAGVPSVLPIAVYAFTHRTFEHGGGRIPLGVAVTGSSTVSTARVSVVLTSLKLATVEEEVELDRLVMRLGMSLPAPITVESRLLILGECYRRFAQSLSRFSCAGWYRYSGHPANFTIDDLGHAVLVDLDSCRQADPSSPEHFALESVRDGMSALYNLACSFFAEDLLDAIPDEVLIEFEPFSSYLDGWDESRAGSNARAGSAIANYVVESRRQLRHFAAFLRSEDRASDHLYRFVRHDRDLTFSWLFRIVFAMRLEEQEAQPLPFGMAELDDRLLRFAGRPRFDSLRALDDAG